MRIVKHAVLSILFFFASGSNYAQKNSLEHYRCELLSTYINGDLSGWTTIISDMQNEKINSLEWQSEIIKAYFGLVGFQLTFEKYDEAKLNISKALVIIEKWLVKYPENAVLNSLLGAFKGYEITLSFYLAPFIGPSSIKYINKGLALDPNEPLCYIVKGNSLLYRSAAFGGNKTEALKCFFDALELNVLAKKQTCNWQRLLNYSFAIKALIETKQEIKAKELLSRVENEYGKLEWINKFVGANIINKPN